MFHSVHFWRQDQLFIILETAAEKRRRQKSKQTRYIVVLVLIGNRLKYFITANSGKVGIPSKSGLDLEY